MSGMVRARLLNAFAAGLCAAVTPILIRDGYFWLAFLTGGCAVISLSIALFSREVRRA